jgi:hypothetical protein
MPRPRRVITPEGYLRCARCRKPKHITRFYQMNSPTWWIDPVTGTEYTKPHSWCVDCLQEIRAAGREEKSRQVERIREEVAKLGPPKEDESSVTGDWNPEEWDQN